MKEAAISAGALLGLLAFAGIYQTSNNRARRNVIVEEETEVISEPQFSIHDVANMTDADWAAIQQGLGISEDDMIPFEVNEEDVDAKQRRRKKGGKPTINKFKLKDIPKLHDSMTAAYALRQNTLLANFVADSGVAPAMRQPADQLDEFAQEAAHVQDGEYPDYSGNDKTAPVVNKFLNEFGHNDDGSNLFKTGNAQLWFLVPAAVPLFGATPDSHLGDYGAYWDFIASYKSALDQNSGRGGNNVRMSIGLYHKGAVYSPRGTKYTTRFPWNRIKNFYLRPRTTTQMPYIIPTAQSVLQWVPRFGSASQAAGDDCYTFWFHQDFAADANQLLLDSQFATMDQLYQVCTVMHIFVGMDKNNANVQAYAAALQPGLQTKMAKDPDFSGVFFADTLADVNSDALKASVNRYMTIVKSRAGCRCMDDGWIPPPSLVEGTGFAFQDPTGGAAVDYAQPTYQAGSNVEITYANYEATDSGATARAFYDQEPTEAPKIPEIDSCCGHDAFSGTPYDSELRTCCDDGNAMPFTRDGSDPCIGDIGFSFKK